MTDEEMPEERRLVEEAMQAAQAGDAGHWPTVAIYLHNEILVLRDQLAQAKKDRDWWKNKGLGLAKDVRAIDMDTLERMVKIVELLQPLTAAVEGEQDDHQLG